MRKYLMVVAVGTVLSAGVFADPPASDPPTCASQVSRICRMDYRVTTTATGQLGFEVSRCGQGFGGGLLGNSRFDVGDVILSVGTANVQANDDLDVLLTRAMRQRQRTVTIIDSVTKQIKTLGF